MIRLNHSSVPKDNLNRLEEQEGIQSNTNNNNTKLVRLKDRLMND